MVKEIKADKSFKLKDETNQGTLFLHKLSLWALKEYFDEEKNIFERTKIHLTFNISVIHFISVVFLLISAIASKLYFAMVNSSIILVIIMVIIGILKYKKNVRAASIIYSIAIFIGAHIGALFNPNLVMPFNLIFGLTTFLFTFLTLGKKWGLTLMAISSVIWVYYINFLMYGSLHLDSPYTDSANRHYQKVVVIGYIMFSYIIIEFLSLRAYVEAIIQKNNIELGIAKETAEQALQIQEQFFANTSHEIRTPINGVIGLSRQLMETPLSREQKDYLNAIKDSANNLSHIVNDILDISKIRAGKIIFEKTEFRLSELFQTLKFTLQHKAEEKKLILKTHVDSNLPAVMLGDPFRLNQILLNLASNAIKFTDKGEVTIEARKILESNNNVSVEFLVRDTGIGIPKDKLNYVFESFAQAETHTTRKYGGTGLGLSISKSLIEQQGGNIKVESEENKGSAFSFTLSFGIGDSNWRGTEFSQNKNIDDIDLSNLSVLVVDDNNVNRRIASFDLKRWGITVNEAANGQLAIEQLSKNHYDIILMDISMPGMDGMEATKYIRHNTSDDIKDIPIIAMTASAFEGEKEKCMSAGMNDYISKPFNPDTLREKIAQWGKPEFTDPSKVVVSSAHSSTDKKLTDLHLMYENADGNSNYVKNILEVYLKMVPKDLEEFRMSIKESDLKNTQYLCHKIKTTVAYVGAVSIFDNLNIVEREAQKQDADFEKIKSLSKEIISDCNTTIKELETELEKLVL